MDLLPRVMKAYWADRDIPTSEKSHPKNIYQVQFEELDYLVLEFNKNILVYRIRNNGQLKKLKRPPRKIKNKFLSSVNEQDVKLILTR